MMESAEEVLRELAQPLDPDARMQAYYYGFEATGLAVIDRILSAVAIAGKRCHRTEDWNDPWSDEMTEEDRIQMAAEESAEQIRKLLAVAELLLVDQMEQE
ncbi:hypothetical protein COURTHOUSE_138 [Mycobacterium phage Courthouse]|uniref:Uncharacterized protein n=2 Tax=Omegavirus courthouse TaxID=1089119 RepID=G8I5J5_9CAUD|nr:hypothetical protein CM09_gp138 [Mycobacterium phage Courthouse]YP_009205272.1 hypothetical protein AVT17_gp142 [Mycobacterium phage Ariel]AER47989.1 hypothetical protein COURTHOUSE_138 [Mycobacterium phage Courthouse]AIM50019.1 hypothetical protein PBI_ARIEL_142 [Mycobacterium phage Ariel]